MSHTPSPLFFDLDHTLWDFESNSRFALRQGHAELNLDSKGVECADAWIASYEKANEWCWEEYRQGRMDKATLRGARFQLAMEELGVSCSSDLANQLGAHYIQTSPHQTGLIEGTMEVLEVLKSRGHRMWLLTNGFDEVQHLKVANCGLASFFEGVYTSDALGKKKPHPEAFSLAAEAAGLDMNDGIVMIGDSWESDVQGAQNVGWRGVHFNPHHEANPDAWRTVKRLVEILDLPLHA